MVLGEINAGLKRWWGLRMGQIHASPEGYAGHGGTAGTYVADEKMGNKI
jgi:hypothetical protein